MSVLLRRYYQLLTNRSWITVSTSSAIHGAFGVLDGKAVIKAANSYLSDLASTNITKAQALAALINEDPMMVCSLGLEPQGVTMPIRWLVKTGNAYISTGIKLVAQEDSVYVKYIVTEPGKYFIINSNNNSESSNMHVGTFWWRSGYSSHSNKDPIAVSCLAQCPINEILESLVSKNSRYLKSNGVVAAQNNGTYTGTEIYNNGMTIWSYTNSPNSKICEVIVRGENNSTFIPSVHNGQNGMYDIERMQWFGNANSSGAFNIEYTLQDGTPWTPGTTTQ